MLISFMLIKKECNKKEKNLTYWLYETYKIKILFLQDKKILAGDDK